MSNTFQINFIFKFKKIVIAADDGKVNKSQKNPLLTDEDKVDLDRVKKFSVFSKRKKI